MVSKMKINELIKLRNEIEIEFYEKFIMYENTPIYDYFLSVMSIPMNKINEKIKQELQEIKEVEKYKEKSYAEYLSEIGGTD